MFRFVYRLHPQEQLDPASLRVEEFDAFESTDADPHGVTVTGRRCATLADALAALSEGAAFASYQPSGAWRDVVESINASEAPSAGLLLIEPWDDCQTARGLWQLVESITRRNVRIAWSEQIGQKTGQSPAQVIPVLNLRIGCARVSDADATTLDLARRLAGIGYEGLLLIDPPVGDDRFGTARAIAEVIRDVLVPRKPVKPVAAKR
jgi:hypothetical protein